MSRDLPVCTIGHSTKSIGEFVELLRVGQVELVADIRTIPRSRTNPAYNADSLPQTLAAFGIGYIRIAELGGLRAKSKSVPPEVNGFWVNRSFHNYADYALSESFRNGLDALIALSVDRRVAMMCSEAVWWRCHRRIVADYLIQRGKTVAHLIGRDRVEPATMTVAARESGEGLVYPARAPKRDGPIDAVAGLSPRS